MSAHTTYIYLAWILCVLTLSALIGVAYFARGILTEAEARAQAAQDAARVFAERTYNERLRSVTTDTKESRDRLEALAGRDVISIVDSVEAVGAVAGIPLTVSDALSDGEGEHLPGGDSLRPIIFVLETAGSYADIIHALSLLEHLPFPSAIEQVSVNRGGQGGLDQWHASMRLRVYTTTAISS